MKVGKTGKIIPFKNIEFYWDSKYASDWKQDKANQAYEKRIGQEILDEVDRFIKSRE